MLGRHYLVSDLLAYLGCPFLLIHCLYSLPLPSPHSLLNKCHVFLFLSELSWLTSDFTDLSHCPHHSGRNRESRFSVEPQQRRTVSGLMLQSEFSVGGHIYSSQWTG